MGARDGTDDALEGARAAYAAADYRTTYDLLTDIDRTTRLGAEDLDRVAEAAMWVGEHQACIDFGQRAFAAWESTGDVRRAARAAMVLARDHISRHRAAVAGGWYQHAQRLLDGVDDCSEVARLASLDGFLAMFVAKDLDAAETKFVQALTIARAVGDRDLEALQLAMIGTVKVRRGDVDGGMRLVDEAMTSAVTGMLGNEVTAQIYCQTISLCQALGDIRRAHEWTEEAVSCAARPGTSDYPGDCRMHRAEITRRRGDWSGAEASLHQVMGELERWDLNHLGGAWYELGEIALRRGDLAGAHLAFDRAQELGHGCQPGLASLQLAEGDGALAAATLAGVVAQEGPGDPLAAGRMLPVLLEARIESGDLTTAASDLAQLRALAETFATVVLRAEAAIGRARLALAGGDLNGASTESRTAIGLWRDAGLPYETAQAQHVLAEARARADDRTAAIVELDAALAVFEGLGAERDLASARMLRGRLGDLTPGQRVCRTFMFTDVVDSTRLLAAMGDDRWAAVLRWHDRTVRELLAQHGGIEVKQRGGGDGFFAVFADASAAVECACTLQRRFGEHRETAGFAPEVRIGVHQADALMSGHDYAGLGVHEAARIGAVAGANEIVASAATVAAAGVAHASPPVDVELKGLAAPMPVQRVLWSEAGA